MDFHGLALGERRPCDVEFAQALVQIEQIEGVYQRGHSGVSQVKVPRNALIESHVGLGSEAAGLTSGGCYNEEGSWVEVRNNPFASKRQAVELTEHGAQAKSQRNGMISSTLR